MAGVPWRPGKFGRNFFGISGGMRDFALNFLSLRLCCFCRHLQTVDGSAWRQVWKFVEVLTRCGNVENFAADGCIRGCGCETVSVPIEFVDVAVVWAARER